MSWRSRVQQAMSTPLKASADCYHARATARPAIYTPMWVPVFEGATLVWDASRDAVPDG